MTRLIAMAISAVRIITAILRVEAIAIPMRIGIARGIENLIEIESSMLFAAGTTLTGFESRWSTASSHS